MTKPIVTAHLYINSYLIFETSKIRVAVAYMELLVIFNSSLL